MKASKISKAPARISTSGVAVRLGITHQAVANWLEPNRNVLPPELEPDWSISGLDRVTGEETLTASWPIEKYPAIAAWFACSGSPGARNKAARERRMERERGADEKNGQAG